MKLHHLLLVALNVVACAFSASAQDLKPGLWQVTSQVTSDDAEAEKAAAEARQQLASMPPEQRKMMEDMMAKQGVKLGASGPGEMAAKVCMTQEMVERNELPAQQGRCKHSTQPRSGNTVKMTFVCTDPASSGEGQYTIVSPEAYTTKMAVRTTPQGKPQTTNIAAKGKWLAADCGDVKPMRAPAAK